MMKHISCCHDAHRKKLFIVYIASATTLVQPLAPNTHTHTHTHNNADQEVSPVIRINTVKRR